MDQQASEQDDTTALTMYDIRIDARRPVTQSDIDKMEYALNTFGAMRDELRARVSELETQWIWAKARHGPTAPPPNENREAEFDRRERRYTTAGIVTAGVLSAILIALGVSVWVF